MNKKLVYLFAVLVAGLFVISACQQDAIGGRINRNIGDGKIKLLSNTACLLNDDYPASGKRYKCMTKCDDGTEIFYDSDENQNNLGGMITDNSKGHAGCKGMGTS